MRNEQQNNVFIFCDRMNQWLSTQQSFNELQHLQNEIMRLLHHNTIEDSKTLLKMK